MHVAYRHTEHILITSSFNCIVLYCIMTLIYNISDPFQK